jgi:energy-coupling factor transporter ATP-binding protein EcfA2
LNLAPRTLPLDVGITGRNGSGKSTLLQIICGTPNPTSYNLKPMVECPPCSNRDSASKLNSPDGSIRKLPSLWTHKADCHKRTSMKKASIPSFSTNSEVASLFERVAGILESGRGRVLRSTNQETVLAYWLIGRDIVQALQRGEARAQYGNALIADLSRYLTNHYGAGLLGRAT